MLGIGIDTGGTCTDAVIYDFNSGKILGSGKALTTKSNLEVGIANALDTLPQDLIRKAQSMALSTTLATNACLENKGGRAKMLLIGFPSESMDHLRDTFASYGMKNTAHFLVLDAKAEGIFSQPFDPDWEELRKNAKADFGDFDSVGIVQVYPKANGGRFELTAMKILKEELDIPITISYDISNEVDFMKTCAGTLLNAMLIPLISDFMKSIQKVCLERGLKIPVSIILSNGTMMPAETARQFPVQTILCGPAASVVGGSCLAEKDNGIIVDMGGTTTDIAIVQDQIPVTANGGIKIGQWKTMVQGIFVETVALGGDSCVYFNDRRLWLDPVRVIPISVLASQYDSVLPALEELDDRKLFWARGDCEFYVLVKDIREKSGYSEREKRICEELKGGPVTAADLEERMRLYRPYLPTDQLESDGVILRSGLTPTDMMILKGDFSLYDGHAARILTRHVSMNVGCSPEDLPDLVYELVYHKLYHALGRVILSRQFPGRDQMQNDSYITPFLDACYEQAKMRTDHPDKYREAQGRLLLGSKLPLVGVGAPIHLFLPRVAVLLDTSAVIPEHAEVANALGAVVSKRKAYAELKIQAIYEENLLTGFAMPEEGRRVTFTDYDSARAYGAKVILADVKKKARLHGIKGEPRIDLKIEDNRIGHTDDGLILEIIMSASATEEPV